MIFRNRLAGFTLIEMLVVVAIIGILSTASLTIYIDAQRQSRDAIRLQDMQTINDALVAFYIDNRRYPGQPVNPGEPNPPDGISAAGQIIGAGHEIDDALRPYVSEIPRDPAHDTGNAELPSGNVNFFYSYDPLHTVYADCDVSHEMAVDVLGAERTAVFGFHRFESNRERDIVTCQGPGMRLNDADFNRVPQ